MFKIKYLTALLILIHFSILSKIIHATEPFNDKDLYKPGRNFVLKTDSDSEGEGEYFDDESRLFYEIERRGSIPPQKTNPNENSKFPESSTNQKFTNQQNDNAILLENNSQSEEEDQKKDAKQKLLEFLRIKLEKPELTKLPENIYDLLHKKNTHKFKFDPNISLDVPYSGQVTCHTAHWKSLDIEYTGTKLNHKPKLQIGCPEDHHQCQCEDLSKLILILNEQIEENEHLKKEIKINTYSRLIDNDSDSQEVMDNKKPLNLSQLLEEDHHKEKLFNTLKEDKMKLESIPKNILKKLSNPHKERLGSIINFHKKVNSDYENIIKYLSDQIQEKNKIIELQKKSQIL